MNGSYPNGAAPNGYAGDPVTTSVSSDLGATYALRAAVAVSLAASYSILSAMGVSSDLAGTYAIRAAAAADLTGAYNLRSGAAADLAGAYTLRAAAVADLQGAYPVRGAAVSDLAAAYGVSGKVGANLDVNFTIMAELTPIISAARIMDFDARPGAESEFTLRGGVWGIDTDPDDDLFYGARVVRTISMAGTTLTNVEVVNVIGPRVTMDPFIKDPAGFVGVKLSGLDLADPDAPGSVTFRFHCSNLEQFDRTFNLRRKDK